MLKFWKKSNLLCNGGFDLSFHQTRSVVFLCLKGPNERLDVFTLCASVGNLGICLL